MNHFAKAAITDSAELRRILELPRRVVTEEDRNVLAEELTSILKTAGGTMKLRPVQAQALYEIGKHGGGFLLVRVGGGKTLISMLTPFMCGARRPVLVLPAGLKQKTEDDRMRLAKHWRVARDLRILSYEELGRIEGAEVLDFYKPDLIVFDEAHRVKNKKAGVTKRVIRYMRTNPGKYEGGVKCVAMSGTMIKGGTIKAFAHILKWCHKDGAPVPLTEGELEEWAQALDEGTNFNRPRPGALLKLATREDIVEGDDLGNARRGFQRRLVETPGVVSTGGEQVACSLYVRALPFKPNATTDENFLRLRGCEARKLPGWETPDGWPLSMAAEVWRVARELALGFHGVWDPRPPPEWLFARKEWAAFVRETLSRSRTLDTELQVANACSRGELADGEYTAWRDIKDSFRVNPRDVWHDTSALETCEAWIKKGPGIVWVEHVFFGDELERRTGVPYFREGGLDKRGNSLDVLAEMVRTGKQKAVPVIASVAANSTGRNLQPWNRNLITSCPSGAATLEQKLGRTHRDGQESDQVEVDILLACIEHFDAWHKACSEARMTADTIGDSPKILIADVVGFDDSVMVRATGPRWSKQRGGKKNDDTP